MAAHKRWRKVKSAQKATSSAHIPQDSQWIKMHNFSLKKQLQLMHASERIKAFITDMFMINMPLLYLTTYVFLDGKEAFTHNQSAIFACGISYGFITSLFLALSTQTPGYRYMRLRLVRSESCVDKVGFFRALTRYVLWVVGTSFLFGILIGLLRRDGRCLHDVLCKTQVILCEDDKPITP
ncbi:RDD family protein [Helicobacter sp. MIT 21-1697]|uniref:RDD family protein n=1 Tax=Helicobacter sp. MIT 21-1697 TaxID=2993733 RepID=UPI00224B517E|nr:RDD family protein [Helicobacter sp. MIT 21-1697]MCX2717863.1 RDD family protein [Helicobacter sp. MIT 21-1697]